MLLVTQKAMNCYYYYNNSTAGSTITSDDSLEVIPEKYVPHRVPGIMYENKLTYVTFFGTNVEYIHGIHMLPMTPALILIKSRSFALQEWEEFNMGTLSDSLNDTWANVLKLNSALFSALLALLHFSQGGFDLTKLDNGQSRTWSLAFALGMSLSCGS